jgi:hypothetical protein
MDCKAAPAALQRLLLLLAAAAGVALLHPAAMRKIKMGCMPPTAPFRCNCQMNISPFAELKESLAALHRMGQE